MVFLLIYPLSFFSNMLSRFVSLYNYYLSCIGYFLFFVYFLVMKFSVVSELIIVFSVFLLILILIYRCIVLITTASLFVRAVPQYFFWLLLSEEFSSFPVSLVDIFADCNTDCLDEILCIFCVYSGFYNYPLCRIVIVFVCNSWSVLSIS